MEQMLVSIFSLRHFTPEAYVAVVADSETSVRIEQWELLRGYVDEVIPVSFDASVQNKERSRWIKTSLRNLVEGDFLFLDTDTVITADLSEIDTINSEIAMVPDLHCRSFAEYPFQSVSRNIEYLFGRKISLDSPYYNSGVILCKDTERTRQFFTEWHNTWLSKKDKRNGVYDQRSLGVVCEMTGMVEPLPDDYNCQVMASIKYLHTAKIVHFFNIKWSDEPKALSPFFEESFYKQIKGKDCLSIEMQDEILHCKSSFSSSSMIVDKTDMCIWRTSVFRLVRKLYKQHKFIFRAMNKFSRLLLFVIRKIERMGGVKACDGQLAIIPCQAAIYKQKIAA